MNRILIRAAIVSVFAASVVAHGAPAQAPASAHATHRAALVTKIKVTARDIKFKLSAKTAKRGVVVFKVTNVGALKHDLHIKGRTTRKLSDGQSATYGSPSSARATVRTSAQSTATPRPA